MKLLYDMLSAPPYARLELSPRRVWVRSRTVFGPAVGAAADSFGAVGGWRGRASRAGLVLLLMVFGTTASAQRPLCDTQWLAGASESEVAAQVTRGADPNAACDPDGDRPLHHALLAIPPSIDVIQALMDHGADVLVPNRLGKTPWELSEDVRWEALHRYRETRNRTTEHQQAVARTEDIYYLLEGHAVDAFGNPVVGRPLTSLHPCYLAMRPRHLGFWASGFPDLPLSHGENLPVEFYMHNSVPTRYRPVVRAAAAEWNEAAGFHAIAIHREIDHGDTGRRDIPDSRNVIYWSPRSDTEPSPVHMIAGQAAIQSLSAPQGDSFVLITEVDIIIYAAAAGLGPVRKLFENSLRRAGVTQAVGADIASLQRRWLDVLAGMSREHFREWVKELMHEKYIFAWDHGQARFDRWILDAMNERLGNREPLRSFDDLRSWLAEGFAVDLEQLRDHVDRHPPVKDYLLHEFGHALGLDHHPDPGSLMHSGMEITPVPAVPGIGVPATVDDVAVHGLACRYGPLMEADPVRDRTVAVGPR